MSWARRPGRTARSTALTLPLPEKIVLFGGGFPYVVNGEVVGGIGVSGGTVEQDMDIAWYAMSL